jgi:hypothetical protein
MSDNSSREIQEAIQRLAGTFGKKPTAIITANVTSVQEDDRTCSVETVLAEATIKLTGVLLSAEQNDGLIQFPAIDSTVIVAMMPDGENYCIAFSDIDAVICYIDQNNSYKFDSNGFVWNNGALGGLINIVAHTAKLNLLVSQLQAQLTLIATGITGVGGVYTPGTLSTFSKTDFEDTKIKH